ncbi:ABC transporter ATP-binding protein [Acidimangrovimonas sediminis]|uniref:ABC transporter ATP-binding protein n=1 Tax=Acidimangrovimonas sediminis TaxID=2056283 RepID=UPI0018EC3B6E|nr:ABC transporter ATP-binding protein [Acidimangrovimonas sediminis]
MRGDLTMQDGARASTGPASASAPDTAHVTVENLTFDYGGDKPAVDGLNLGIRRGEFLGLLGPSGCGKTTTLRMVAGLIAPTSGRILVGGDDIVARPPWERNLGLVFQSYALFPHMSVAQNVAFGLRLRKLGRTEVADRVQEALRTVRLDGLGDRKPAQLSGGQQQRVAIARAIVIRPDILLLDEPLSNLDARLRDEMRFELRDIQMRTGITTLFVTHDQQEALTLCDRIAVMNGGKLEQVGTPEEIYDRPGSRFVSHFIGRANGFDCRVTGSGAAARLELNGRALPHAADLPPGPDVTAVLRPHAVELCTPDEGILQGVVHRRAFMGNALEIEVELEGGQMIFAELRPGGPGDDSARPGRAVGLTWRPEAIRVFPA